jgi:hypothetical protein
MTFGIGYAEGGGSTPHLFVPPPKNREGQFGPRCTSCDGWGYILRLKGGGSCSRCAGGGVEPVEDPILQAYKAGVRRELLAVQQLAESFDPGRGRDLLIEKLRSIKCSRQYWEEMVWWVTASGAAVANTVTETILFPNVTIPANYMQDGRALRLRAQGQHSTLGSGTVTLTFRLRWGGVSGTVICMTGAITQLVSLTAAFWDLDILVQTRSNGATGTVMGNGNVKVFGATAPTIGSATGAPAISPMTAGGQITPAVATLDLTADTALSLSIQHGAASASNTTTGLNYIGESLN